jgi:serine/threonine protein kinase
MTPEFYEQVCRICYSALHLDVDQRPEFLDRTCGVDESLRAAVEAMLAQEGRLADFLATPALPALPAFMDAANFSEQVTPGAMLGGRYLIEKELGQGGTCAVFLARDRKLHDAPVVIKVLLNLWLQTGRRTWLEKKFKGEIEALSSIDHPGVVRALDVGALPDGRSYLVMQYVSGDPLRSAMTPEGMEFERMAKIVRQMGQALSAAHRRGVIHRDLKPENIMLQRVDDEEYVKLIDFGIASVHEATDGVAAEAADCRTTEIVGTRCYVAPEQLRGKPVAASDIYALGVIAYEMATGRRPFDNESILELYESQRAGVKVKPIELRHDLPETAQAIILRALSFAPRDRFAHAKDFTEALADCLTGTPNHSPPRAFVSRRRLPLILASILAVAIGLLTLLRVNFKDEIRPERSETTPVTKSERSLIYTMEARRSASHRPRARPFATFDNVIFGPDDEIRFHISSPQSGYLYVLNEGPMRTGGLPDFNILFPDADNGGSPELRAGNVISIPPPGPNRHENWFVFDDEEGVEIIWLVWSENAVPELEAVRSRANPRDHGAIHDLTQRTAISHYLAPFSAIKPRIERDDLNKQTRLKTDGGNLVWMMKLEHR